MLFEAWKRGGAWDEARPDAEVLRAPRESREASAVGVIREMVLEALSEGHTAESAAEKSGVSVTTVRSQIRKVYQKLGVTNRRDALATAQERGLLTGRRRRPSVMRVASAGRGGDERG